MDELSPQSEIKSSPVSNEPDPSQTTILPNGTIAPPAPSTPPSGPVKLKRERASEKNGENATNPKKAKPAVPSHPDCDRCKHAKTPGDPAPWAIFLKNFISTHPLMDIGKATIEARKRYVPPNGQPKTFEKIAREVWKAKNPNWKKEFEDTEEGKAKLADTVRNWFLELI